MTKVTREEFCRFIGKWRMVVDLNYNLPISHEKGWYRQKTFYSMKGVVGSNIVPNLDNPLGAITYYSTTPINYHVNRDAVEEGRDEPERVL